MRFMSVFIDLLITNLQIDQYSGNTLISLDKKVNKYIIKM